jgi:hypothetical protein
LLSLLGIASPPLLILGGVGLDHVRGHTRALAKLRESGVYDSGKNCDLLHDRGSCIPCLGEGICHGVRGIL